MSDASRIDACLCLYLPQGSSDPISAHYRNLLPNRMVDWKEIESRKAKQEILKNVY